MSNSQEIKYAVFKLEDQEYCIDISKVSGIERYIKPTKIPNSSQLVLGIINLRDETIPIISTRNLVGKEECEECDSTRIIVILKDNEKIGIKVDEVKEIITKNSSQIEKVKVTDNGIEHTADVIKIEERIVIILDILKEI